MKTVLVKIKDGIEKPKEIIVEITRRENYVVIRIDEVEYLIPIEIWGVYIN